MNNIEFISAGAGSGKTYRLTTTLAEALETGAARPHAVLATTFTVKAATELRERARAWLLDKGRLDLATAIGQAKLGTVNSVCGQLLQRFCFEMGLSPDQTVLSEAHSKRLLKTALDETLDGFGQVELSRLTTRFGIDQADWAESIGNVVHAARNNDLAPETLRLMGARNADLMLENWPAPTTGIDHTAALQMALATAEKTVADEVDSLQASGAKVTKVMLEGLHELQRLNRIFREGRWTWPDWIAACNIDAGAKMRDTVAPAANAAQTHSEHPAYHADVRRYLDLVFGLAADALDTYAQTKRQLGAVDFSDQEILLLRAVRENQDVRDALADELDLIMVDEFQDTSPLQLALFVELARLARRSVWVGDPKQAIYGFRGTDASLIAGVLAAIEGWGGKIGEPLTISRRSTPALVSLTNQIFVPAFQPDDLPADAVRLAASRSDIAGQPSLLNWDFESSKNETDYLGLGPAVRELLDSGLQVEDKTSKKLRNVRPGDIAILCRKNDQVDLAVTALARWGIPSASPRAGLLGTPEVLFVLACLRRILDAGDTVATALILTLADGVPVSEWLADRLAYLSDPEAKPYEWKLTGDTPHPLLTRLESLRPNLLAMTPSEALRLAKAESHVARVASQWSTSPHEARTRIANVETLVELGKTYEDECVAVKRPATVSGLLQWLTLLAETGDDDRAATADNAVSVLTHHGAKGLEWPVVILTSLGTESRSALWDVRARTDGTFDPQHPLDHRFVHFWPRTWGKRKQPQAAVNAEASEIGRAMARDARAEGRRLLYVSMTRARDVNVLVSCVRKQQPNRKWIDEVGASQLLFWETGTRTLILEDGLYMNMSSKTWSAEECAVTPPQQQPIVCNWFRTRPPIDEKPLWFRPSGAEGGAYAVAEVEPVGTRLAISAKADMTTIGTAMHLCIARAGTSGKTDLDEIDQILVNWGVSDALDKKAVASQVEALLTWVAKRWPDRPVHIEVPIEADRPDGSRLRGRIDFLIDVEDGWILLDHKSNPGGASRDADIANEHGAQLASYAEALTRATGRPVKEQWLYLPVGARAVRVEAIPA
ncbi:UvrD-helicase domain-containing protein [Paraburkholderia domus]|uniref:DNA 3'-5' helicase n=1 Tax=Paraburkholderia domus TaxID=2793075 RepID=A0A9N8N0V1_9BURK|nr:UvrD-helicase domain-containing protein [Paraburkholderia domus]MBK5168922.1 UvrD-helicase domain-containing protein [Burkholderia sp. R-70211]CAE6934408.1 ATP-dependent helicase/nuclease subunit A [Paraburkholderia domus]